MTVLTTTPKNPNFLPSNKFQLNFTRCPNLQFFCQTVIVPGISMMEVARETPFVDLYSPGIKAIYEVLNVTFLIDEDLLAWKEVHDWIRAMVFPENFEEYVALGKIAGPSVRPQFPQFSDAYLTLLNSSNNPIYKFKFIDVFPVALSSFNLSTTFSPDVIVTADISFRYSYYQIESLI